VSVHLARCHQQIVTKIAPLRPMRANCFQCWGFAQVFYQYFQIIDVDAASSAQFLEIF
jgi:hypothetical protein